MRKLVRYTKPWTCYVEKISFLGMDDRTSMVVKKKRRKKKATRRKNSVQKIRKVS